MNFKIDLSIYVKNDIGILMGIAMKLWIAIGGVAILQHEFCQFMNMRGLSPF
jgi:hypothetical protein